MTGYDPNDDNPDHALTFDEWSAMGYWIKKGSHSDYRSPDGKALFTPNQVNPPRRRRKYGASGGGKGGGRKTMLEESSDRARAKGTPFGVVEDFDSYVREAGMLPDLHRTVFAVNDPLESYFMGVADKHGILDMLAFGEDMEDY